MTPQGLCQRRMRETGRCVTCCQPHDSGMARCRTCQDKANARHRTRRDQMIAMGRCQECRRRPVEDYTRCIECRIKLAARGKAAHARKKAA